VVTRSRSQASTLVDRLTGMGAEVVELPVIAVADPRDGGAALRDATAAAAGGRYDWVAVTSVNAVERFFAAAGDRPPAPGTRWAVVGRGTADALHRFGGRADLVPPEAVSESLAEAFPVAGPSGGTRVLVPRAETVRGVLADGLRAKGYAVDEVVAYRTVTGQPGAAAVAAVPSADAVVFTSSSTVERFVDLLGPGVVPPVVVSIGPVTSAAARRAGMAVTAEAVEHDLDGLVAALGTCW